MQRYISFENLTLFYPYKKKKKKKKKKLTKLTSFRIPRYFEALRFLFMKLLCLIQTNITGVFEETSFPIFLSFFLRKIHVLCK